MRCLVCDKQQAKGNRADPVCDRCVGRATHDLDLIAHAWKTSTDPGWPSQGQSRSGNNKPLPGGTAWVSWRQGADLVGVLRAWADDWVDAMELVGPTGDSVLVLVKWLRTHLHRAAQTSVVFDVFSQEIHDQARIGCAVAGLTETRGQRIQCPTDGCTRWIRVDARHPNEVLTCRGCRTEWTMARLVAVALVIDQDVWIDPEAASALTGLDQSTLRRWARAGKIRRHHGQYELKSVQRHATPGFLFPNPTPGTM